MPSPWKKGSLGGISRLLVSSLRSKAQRGVGDSPLVVQAGFPTSVADLVVKNRSRLRKPSRCRRQPGPAGDGGDAKCSTMAVLTSEIVAAATANVGAGSNDDDRVLCSPPGPPPEVDEQRQRSPVTEECGDLGSLIGAETPKDESLPGLHGSKASVGDGPQPFPAVPKLSKVESFEGLHRSKAKEDPRVDQGITRSKAEKDDSFLASAPSKVPETEPRESSPTAVTRRGEDCGVPSAPEEAEQKVPGGGGSGGFMVVVKVAFLILILAVVSKKVAVAVSVSAFAILFAESFGKRLIPLPGPCEEAKKGLATIAGSAPLPDVTQTPGESASHIRGAIPILSANIGDPDLGCFRSESNWVAKAPVNAAAAPVETTSLALEEKDCVEIEGCRGDQEASTLNRNKEKKKKKKKLFKNFVPNKLRGSKGVKGGKMAGKLEPLSLGDALAQKGTEEAVEEEEEEGGEDGDRGVDEKRYGEEEEEGLCSQIPAMAHDVALRDAAFVREKMGQPAKGGSEHLVFFVLILCGLVGGRVVALFLTVLWYSLSPSARSLWRGWTAQRCLEAAPDASTLEGLSTGRKG